MVGCSARIVGKPDTLLQHGTLPTSGVTQLIFGSYLAEAYQLD